MPIYDNDGTTNYEIGKLYDNDGTTDHQIGKVYDNNGTTDYLIYSAEETIFSGVSFNSGATLSGGDGGANMYKAAYSSEYSIDFSSWDTLTITGTVGGVRTGGGSYNRGTYVQVQYSTDGGASWSHFTPSLFEAHIMSTESKTVDQIYDVSSLTATNGKIRVYCACQNSNTSETSGGYAYCENLACVAK